MTMRSLIILILCSSAVAGAEPVVLAVDKTSIYVELGARDGVGAGTELELLHEVTVKDPRTGQTLRDHFALGTMTVLKSGDKISVASTDAELVKRVIAGDRVRVVSPLRKFADPWAERVTASKGAPAVVIAPPTPGKPGVDHVALVRAAWQDTLGKPPEHRIDRWLELLKADPAGPYRAAVQQEIASLKAQVAKRDAALAAARSTNANDLAPRIARLAAALGGTAEELIAAAPIPRAVPGKPIQLGFLIRAPQAVGEAHLYTKGPNEPGFKRITLARDGDAYLRGAIDAAQVRGPEVQWYVEVVDRAGEVGDAIGSRNLPQVIKIDDDVREAPIEAGRSHVDAHVDYVDFDGKFNKGFDEYYQAEADFTYRFIKPIYAVRLGFGTLSGEGGPKDVIDEGNDCVDGLGQFRCRKVTFSYVYTELEFRIRPNVALMLRPQAGLLSTDRMQGGSSDRCAGADVAGCEFLTGFGFRARLRLGEEQGTNLVLGAGFTDEVGTLLEAAYHWLPAAKIPVQLSVQVTDMPVPENFGVRLIGDVGYRSLSWFYPSLRLSYQARDIDHAGVSGGLAMNFDW
jgi:uncharacterized small protein (DUF1192 family)